MARGAGRARPGCRVTTAAIDSVAAVRDCVRDARARGAALRVVGRGTWLDAGRPVRATESLSTRELAGIVEYVPGDLTITTRAGTTLAEIADAVTPHNQWLALDPCGTPDGTIGATVATASAGPLSTFFGGPRDLALGLEFVTGAGAVARGGGRVVKNVAGFDLTRLMIGAWGTLGVITEVALRLHARPDAEATLAIPLQTEDKSAEQLDRLAQLLSRLPFTPFACEVVNAAFAQALLGVEHTAVLLRIGGNAEALRAQRQSFAELGDAREVDVGVWQKLRTAESERAMVLRLSARRSELSRTWSEACSLTAGCTDVLLHARPVRGVVRCIVPASESNARALRASFAERGKATRIGERLPAELWPLCAASATPTADPLSQRLKAAFDPAGVLNPGIFGESS